VARPEIRAGIDPGLPTVDLEDAWHNDSRHPAATPSPDIQPGIPFGIRPWPPAV